MSRQTCPDCTKPRLAIAFRDETIKICDACGWTNKFGEVRQLSSEQEELIDFLQEKVCFLEAKDTHRTNLEILSKRDPKIVKVIVGSGKTVLNCNRALLCYYSSMFENSFFSKFKEATSGEINLEEDLENVVATFGTWAETGEIPVSAYSTPKDGEYATLKDGIAPDDMAYDIMAIATLWVFGDKVMSPSFADAAMRLFLKALEKVHMGADTAEYIFDNTTEGAKLRKLVVDAVLSEGPFRKGADKNYRKGWLNTLANGGDLVQECVVAGGFSAAFEDHHPSEKQNRPKYFENVKLIKATEWRKHEVFKP